jgi:hypothetical protein
MFLRTIFFFALLLCANTQAMDHAADNQYPQDRKSMLEIGAIGVVMWTPIITGAILGATILKPATYNPGLGAINGAIVGCLADFGLLCIAGIVKQCIVEPIKNGTTCLSKKVCV